jgi:hypothetical protein
MTWPCWPRDCCGRIRSRVTCPRNSDGALAHGCATAELHHETGRDLLVRRGQDATSSNSAKVRFASWEVLPTETSAHRSKQDVAD